MAKPVTSMTIY